MMDLAPRSPHAPASADPLPRHLAERGRAIPRGGVGAAGVCPRRQRPCHILGLVSQGCAPPDHLVPVPLEATGLFTRPLVPSGSGHRCQQAVSRGLPKSPREERPWAWSAGSVHPRPSCSPGCMTWTSYLRPFRLPDLQWRLSDSISHTVTWITRSPVFRSNGVELTTGCCVGVRSSSAF